MSIALLLIIKRLVNGCRSVLLNTLGVVELLLDEVEKCAAICRVQQVTIGTKKVESSSYFVRHTYNCTATLRNR